MICSEMPKMRINDDCDSYMETCTIGFSGESSLAINQMILDTGANVIYKVAHQFSNASGSTMARLVFWCHGQSDQSSPIDEPSYC